MQAEPLLLQALEIRQKSLKPNHPHIAVSLNVLGRLYLEQIEYTRAEPLLLQALEIPQKTPESARVAEMAPLLNNLARLYSAKEDFLKAGQLCQQAYTLCQETLGSSHPTAIEILEDLKRFELPTRLLRPGVPWHIAALPPRCLIRIRPRWLHEHHRAGDQS